MLNYRLNGRLRFEKRLKRLLDEFETGLSRPNWWQLMIMMMMMMFWDKKWEDKIFLTLCLTFRKIFFYAKALVAPHKRTALCWLAATDYSKHSYLHFVSGAKPLTGSKHVAWILFAVVCIAVWLCGSSSVTLLRNPATIFDTAWCHSTEEQNLCRFSRQEITFRCIGNSTSYFTVCAFGSSDF